MTGPAHLTGRARVRTCSLLLALASVLVAVVPGALAAAAVPAPLALLSLHRAGADRAAAVVDVPSGANGPALAGGAFRVTVDGAARPARASRLLRDDLQLVAVVDPTVGLAALLEQQGALRELVLDLPAAARVGLVVMAPGPVVVVPPTAARPPLLQALLDVRPAAGRADLGAGLQRALAVFDRSAPDHLLLVSRTDRRSPAPSSAVQAAVRSAGVRVFGCGTTEGPGSAAVTGLAAVTGGVRGSATDLLACHDAVLQAARGRYRISFDVGATGGLVRVSLAAVAESPAYGVLPASSEGSGGGSPLGRRGRVLAALGALVLLQAALAALLLVRGRRRGRGAA